MDDMRENGEAEAINRRAIVHCYFLIICSIVAMGGLWHPKLSTRCYIGVCKC